jgi:hypothetical protein
LQATTVSAPVETPVLRLFREIQAITAVMDDRATSQEEFDRLYAENTALEWRLTREPATCAAAKVLQLTCLRDDYGTIFEPELKAELEALVGGRGANGQTPLLSKRNEAMFSLGKRYPRNSKVGLRFPIWKTAGVNGHGPRCSVSGKRSFS